MLEKFILKKTIKYFPIQNNTLTRYWDLETRRILENELLQLEH